MFDRRSRYQRAERRARRRAARYANKALAQSAIAEFYYRTLDELEDHDER